MRSIILLMLLAVAGHPGGVLAAERVTHIYSGTDGGELEPCGCSPEGDLGGVRRTATLLDHLRAEQTNLFAVSAGGLMSGFAAHGRLTSEFILKGYALLHLAAVGREQLARRGLFQGKAREPRRCRARLLHLARPGVLSRQKHAGQPRASG